MRWVVILSALLVLGAPTVAQERAEVGTLDYAVLYADESGVTHFRDETMPWFTSDETNPLAAWSTAYQTATDIGFLRLRRSPARDGYGGPGASNTCARRR